jgi:hypothetical protein
LLQQHDKKQLQSCCEAWQTTRPGKFSDTLSFKLCHHFLCPPTTTVLPDRSDRPTCEDTETKNALQQFFARFERRLPQLSMLLYTHAAAAVDQQQKFDRV